MPQVNTHCSVLAQREALSATFSCLLRLDAGRESSNVCQLPEKEPAAMTKALLRGESDQVTREIAALSGLTVKQLKERWRSLYAAEPPRYISRELLTGAVAYRLQERAFGGLKPATQRARLILLSVSVAWPMTQPACYFRLSRGAGTRLAFTGFLFRALNGGGHPLNNFASHRQSRLQSPAFRRARSCQQPEQVMPIWLAVENN